jgi:RNA polymerase sigma factor (sigma-70 family)
MVHAVDDSPPDAALLEAVRAGDLGAYDALFRRHAEPARHAALRWGAKPAEQQDLVAEAFVRVLIAIRGGAGPRENLRPYLLVTMRHLAIKSREGRVDLYGTEPEVDGEIRDAEAVGSDEIVVRRWSTGLAWSAFRTLPLRWRAVLWYTEVESVSPAELAPRLGISPNGVAALALRAREGLRQAYLQVQVPETVEPSCHGARQHLGTWVRSGLSPQRAQAITDHLAGCGECRAVVDALEEANGELRPAAPATRGLRDEPSVIGVSRVVQAGYRTPSDRRLTG